jgi:hypothetical protein
MQFGYLYDVCTGTGEVSGGFMVLSHHHHGSAEDHRPYSSASMMGHQLSDMSGTCQAPEVL